MTRGRFSSLRQNLYSSTAGRFTWTADSTLTPPVPESARFVSVSAVEMPAVAYTGQCAVLARYSNAALNVPSSQASRVRRSRAHAPRAAPAIAETQRSASLMFRRGVLRVTGGGDHDRSRYAIRLSPFVPRRACRPDACVRAAERYASSPALSVP